MSSPPRLPWASNKLLGATSAETIAKTRDDVYLSPSVIDDIAGGGAGEWGEPTEITLDTDGVAAITEPGWYLIDTFADAADDNIVKIEGLSKGDEVIVSPANSARTVNIIDGTYIELNRDMIFTMDNTSDCMILQCIDAGNNICRELGPRVSGGT